MSYTRLDHRLYDHPKWESLSDGAFRLGIRAICWARGHMREPRGFIPAGMLPSLARRSPSVATRFAFELVAAGRPAYDVGIWEPVDGGWLVHDFQKYDPVSEQYAAPVPSKSEAGRIGGMRSAEVRKERRGSAQPVPTFGPDASSPEADTPASASSPEAAPEAAPEAPPKQDGFASADGHGFPPDPLSDRNTGSGSKEAEGGAESGSGIKQDTTHLVSAGARESAALVLVAASAPIEFLPPGRTRKSSKRVGSWRRVPADWFVKDDHRSMAIGLLVDVEFEAAAFRDHEFQRPRTDADATFRNWLREASRRPRSRSQGAAPVTNAGSALLSRVQRMAQGEKK